MANKYLNLSEREIEELHQAGPGLSHYERVGIIAEVTEEVEAFSKAFHEGDSADWLRYVEKHAAEKVNFATLHWLCVGFICQINQRNKERNRRLDELEKQVEELKATQFEDCGVWKESTIYRKGNGVSHQGSFWIAQTETAERPGGPETGWRLAVKAGREGKPGRDGRDLRNLSDLR